MMTLDEAIDVLKNDIEICTIQQKEAVDMAIKALDSWDKYSSELWKSAYDRGFKDGVSEGIKAME